MNARQPPSKWRATMRSTSAAGMARMPGAPQSASHARASLVTSAASWLAVLPVMAPASDRCGPVRPVKASMRVQLDKSQASVLAGLGINGE